MEVSEQGGACRWNRSSRPVSAAVWVFCCWSLDCVHVAWLIIHYIRVVWKQFTPLSNDKPITWAHYLAAMCEHQHQTGFHHVMMMNGSPERVNDSRLQWSLSRTRNPPNAPNQQKQTSTQITPVSSPTWVGSSPETCNKVFDTVVSRKLCVKIEV